MSINWVMLHENEAFIRLPNERLIYTSPPRTSFSLQPPSGYSGRESLSLQSNSGLVYLTNQRIVYLPSQPSQELQSFSAPLLNLHDTHVSAPFFGPNVWTALVQPVAGGGIPPSFPAVQLKMSFKEGGAFDFHSNFERVKERLQQAVETSQATSNSQAARRGHIDYSAVHLEELPAYDSPGHAPAEPNHASPSSVPLSGSAVHPPGQDEMPPPPVDNIATEDRFEPPTEPPPGYEEVQQQSVAHELESRLRSAS
ncbi:hypothetical protein DTO164E3_3728 [Paecilomyces variotii]|nr:hypothetical protein DTO164E3_3728 [Paecilomyces variotii]KAJ9206163.1 hypothetical protein DTO032I3_2028 [Paecilomyces variotii]KAJ9222523.1 hypothetical protein DTO169C6_5114 [Paecilomyces variotii]KAJ9264317.1 hypothetical protein DTO195F2_2477 [Paecilomyces variotii]KAJ9281634.1 hypothetical protein DTO021D3_1400 [Paecilomyces variotii]